jgi:divalent metal cation (Fe/Co/Zn/Cd) transporter
MDHFQTVQEAHEVVSLLKKAINDKLSNTRVTIHVDPCQGASPVAEEVD